MSHELTLRTAGTAEMAYVGETPWHGLGQVLQVGASIEQWQEAAGMDWKIQRSRVRYPTAFGQADSEWMTMDDQHVLFRSDTRAPLGIVSDKYKIVQPKQVLEFFRDLVSDCGFQLETAGTLFGGRRFWALAKLSEARLAGWDRVGGYVLLSTSADGTMATSVRETTVRVVCNNTLSMAAAERGNRKVSVRHSTRFDANLVKAELGLVADRFDRFMETCNELVNIHVSDRMAAELVAQVMRPTEVVNGVEVMSKKPHRGEERVMQLFMGDGKGSVERGSCNTAWGVLNACSEWVDHWAPAKSVDHRLDRAWYGSGDELKNKMFRKLIELA